MERREEKERETERERTRKEGGGRRKRNDRLKNEIVKRGTKERSNLT